MKLKSTTIPTIAIAGFGVLCGITGCTPSDNLPQQPKTFTKTENPNFTVELLFEHDGVKVFRFYDAGRYRYYADARGSVQWSEQSGKSTTTQKIQTIK